MPKEVDVKIWQDRIKNGQRFQLKFAQSAEWNRYKGYYRQRGYAKNALVVNMMFSILRSMVPQIYFRNPKITVTARKPGLEAFLHARLVQTLDNWLLKELASKREFKKLIADNFFCGLGVGFYGYDSEYGFKEKMLDPSGQFSLSQFDSKGNRIEYNSNVSIGMPWFLRARPDDVVFPWGATDRDNLPWVALRVFRPLDNLKSDKKYSNTADLAGTTTPRRTTPEGAQIVDPVEGMEGNKDIQWVELWQVNDAQSGKVLALTIDSPQFLRNDKDDLQIEGLPSEIISFNPDPDYIYGIPDARVIEPQLLELIDIRTQAMKHRKIDLVRMLAKKGVMSDEDLQKMTSGEVNPVVFIDSDMDDIRKAVANFSPGVSGILQDMAMQASLAQGDIRETVGFSRTAQGEYQGKTHISAEETSKVFQSLNIRLDERRDEMSDLIVRVVRKWNQMIFTYWTTERISQIVGPDGAQWWLKFTGPQIQGEFDYAVSVGEGVTMDAETKKNLALEAGAVWAKLNAGAIAQGAPVPAEIQRLIFSQFEDTGLDIDRLLAQTGALASSRQPGVAGQSTGAGQSPQSAVSPQALAQLMAQRQGGTQ